MDDVVVPRRGIERKKGRERERERERERDVPDSGVGGLVQRFHEKIRSGAGWQKERSRMEED